MRLFAPEEVIGRLESEWRAGTLERDLPRLVELAWYLRQCPQARSYAVLTRARALATGHDAVSLRDRLALIDAEAAWLSGRPNEAIRALEELAVKFRDSQEPTGECDALYLKARALISMGRRSECDEALSAAIRLAQAMADPARTLFLQAQWLRLVGSADPTEACARFPECFADMPADVDPVVASALAIMRSGMAHQQDDPARSVYHLTRAFEWQCATAQEAAAVISALNIAEAFKGLNDQDAALEWSQRALERARSTSWPLALGPALMRVGESLRRIERLEASCDLLREAIEVYRPFRGSRNFAVMQCALAETWHLLGQSGQAIDILEEAAAYSLQSDDNDLLLDVRKSQVECLHSQGRYAEAGPLASEGLALARTQGASLREADILSLMAAAQAEAGHPEQALTLLTQAIQIEQAQPGVIAEPERLNRLADYQAACGQFEQAYLSSQRANKAYAESNRAKAHARATAIQVRMDTERIRADAEQQRQRMELLQRTSTMLEHLGAIGQEITAQLNKEKVFETIYRHVHGLLETDCFSIYLMDPDGQGMTSVYDLEAGQTLPPDHVELHDQDSNAARCVRERTELLLNFAADVDDPSHLPGTLRTLSALFAPLVIGDRVLGVMTIQTAKEHAYGEQDRLIFRTLCAYAAIALDNSVAYSYLRDAQEQIVVHEKLAALGSLVAGVAHELNTPIGNALLTAGTLHERAQEIRRELEQGALRKAALNLFIADADVATTLITRGLASAADLVQKFKQVAVDRATEQRRRFDLGSTTTDVLATMAKSIERAGHRVEVAIPDGIVLDGYPGPYGQVLTNLVNNAMFHAFEGKVGGVVRISAELVRGKMLEIRFSDDGHGISEENLKRVFDPFFTTRMGSGGSGLGLAISYNIATALFGGEFRVESQLGEGATFVWRLPLAAPAQGTSGAVPAAHSRIY